MRNGFAVMLSVMATLMLGAVVTHCDTDKPCMTAKDCGEGEWCNAALGVCEMCSCASRQCGEDPCGNSCGTCDAGQFCNEAT